MYNIINVRLSDIDWSGFKCEVHYFLWIIKDNALFYFIPVHVTDTFFF